MRPPRSSIGVICHDYKEAAANNLYFFHGTISTYFKFEVPCICWKHLAFCLLRRLLDWWACGISRIQCRKQFSHMPFGLNFYDLFQKMEQRSESSQRALSLLPPCHLPLGFFHLINRNLCCNDPWHRPLDLMHMQWTRGPFLIAWLVACTNLNIRRCSSDASHAPLLFEHQRQTEHQTSLGRLRSVCFSSSAHVSLTANPSVFCTSFNRVDPVSVHLWLLLLVWIKVPTFD